MLITAVAVVVVAATVILVMLSEVSDRMATLHRIDQARELFQEYGVDSYTVDIERSCFCDTNFLTFTLTVKDGKVTHVAVRGLADRHQGVEDTAEWDRVPKQYDWLDEWGPIDHGLATAAATVAGDESVEGPFAMYISEGDHELVTKFSFNPRTGVPRSYSSYISNTYDSQVSFRWSNFRPLEG